MHLSHDLGFDSLARLELAATIEEKTGSASPRIAWGRSKRSAISSPRSKNYAPCRPARAYR